MKSRHRSREIALQILYQNDLTNILPTVVIKPVESSLPVSTIKETVALLQRHFGHFNVPEPLREFVAELVTGTLAQKTEIDALLEKYASHWKVNRMSSVDRSILRMAAYEMLHQSSASPDSAVPPSVIIDEAIELAKQFGTAETASFINGILDSVKDHIKLNHASPSEDQPESPNEDPKK